MALDFKSAYEKAAPSKDEIQGCQEEIFRSCISHLEDIATAYGLDEYQSELKELRERVENPELKIAIIGDFNTGKSTFINALLKDQTLSTAGIPTTVIPTYIRWNGSDAKPLITVKFFEDANEYDFQTDYALLKEKLGFEFHNDAKGIEEITTNNDLIHLVEYVQIVYPYDARFDRLCIIDTPGVNPGAEETKEHAFVTREVLRKQADTTIILFPADAMGKRTAFEYIQDNAAHLVENASFIITKMDMVEGESTEQQLPDLLKGFIRQQLNVEPQKVYHCSARYALAHFTGKLKSEAYAADFESMQNEMLEDIQEKKSIILNQKITTIIQQISDKLQDTIQTQEDTITEELYRLEQYSVQNFQKEYAQMQQEYEQNVIELCNKMNGDISSKLGNIQSSINSLIDMDLKDCNGIQALRNYANEGIKKRLDTYEKKVVDAIKKDADRFDEQYLAFSKDISECLNRYEYEVGQIQETDRQGNIALTKPKAVTIGGIQSDNLIAGAAIAGIVLLFLNPVVLLGVIGVAFVGGSLVMDAMRNRLINKIKSGVSQSTPDITKEWKEANESNLKAYLERGSRLANQYEEYYSELFTQKKKEYTDKQDKLMNELESAMCTRSYLELISDALLFSEYVEQLYDAPMADVRGALHRDMDSWFNLLDFYEPKSDEEATQKRDHMYSCIMVLFGNMKYYIEYIRSQDPDEEEEEPADSSLSEKNANGAQLCWDDVCLLPDEETKELIQLDMDESGLSDLEGVQNATPETVKLFLEQFDVTFPLNETFLFGSIWYNEEEKEFEGHVLTDQTIYSNLGMSLGEKYFFKVRHDDIKQFNEEYSDVFEDKTLLFAILTHSGKKHVYTLVS